MGLSLNMINTSMLILQAQSKFGPRIPSFTNCLETELKELRSYIAHRSGLLRALLEKRAEAEPGLEPIPSGYAKIRTRPGSNRKNAVRNCHVFEAKGKGRDSGLRQNPN